jgi:hypothetical protein
MSESFSSVLGLTLAWCRTKKGSDEQQLQNTPEGSIDNYGNHLPKITLRKGREFMVTSEE